MVSFAGRFAFVRGAGFFCGCAAPPLPFALKPVADPEHRHKPQARAQFAPQMVDMDIHRAGAQPAGHAPHLGQQLPAGQSPPGLEDEAASSARSVGESATGTPCCSVRPSGQSSISAYCKGRSVCVGSTGVSLLPGRRIRIFCGKTEGFGCKKSTISEYILL